MKKTVKIFALALAVALAAALLSACSLLPSSGTTGPTTTTTPPPPGQVTIVGDGTSDYVIVSPHKSEFVGAGLSNIAIDIRQYITATIGASGVGIKNDSVDPVEKEILIGDTNRAETATVVARLAQTAGDGYFQYAIAEVNGKLVIYGDDVKAYTVILKYFLENYCTETEISIPKDCYDVQTMTWQAYDDYLVKLEEEEQKRKEEEALAYLNELKERLRNLPDVSKFGGYPTLTVPQKYLDLEFTYAYPQAGAHPRVVINRTTLATVKENLSATENVSALRNYKNYYNTDINFGILPTVTGSSAKKYNHDEDILNAIEARAFKYIVEGDVAAGYEAVLGIQNYIYTLDIWEGDRDAQGILSDTYRRYGQTMFVAAEVYDWCYPLMTKADRERIIAGAMNLLGANMEVGFPPEKQACFAGHGAEGQILRDYFAFSIACYDEYPELYAFIMGRLQDHFVPIRDYYFQSGVYTQQGNSYGLYRFNCDVWASHLYKTMQNDANPEPLYSVDLKTLGEAYIYNVRPDDTMLRLGDETLQRDDVYEMNSYCTLMFYIGATTDSAVAKAECARFSRNFANCFVKGDQMLTGVHFLALNDPSLEPVSRDALPLAFYAGSPVGQTFAHSAWDSEDAVLLYMKIGEKYSTGHEHKDAGQFQIYYKGILASDSGYYDLYLSDVHANYTRQTIAHNCLLIYDPSEKTGAINDGGMITFPDEESGSLTQWLSRDYTDRGVVIGQENAYHEDGSMNYAYLAGDLTTGYSASKVDEVLRHMLGVFTDDDNSKMVFFVFDKISATNADFQKTFLLHMENEPIVFDNYSVITNDGGMLVNQTLLPTADQVDINVVEGAYVLYDGVTELELVARSWGKGDGDDYECSEEGWGRIMIQPTTGRRTDYLLNVMYVTDEPEGGASTTAEGYTAAVCYENNLVIGASIFNQAAFFSKTLERIDTRFTVEGSGEGTMTYTVAGVIAGEWSVYDASGNLVTTATATEEGGLISFEAAAGEYTLVAPGEANTDIPGDGVYDDPYRN